MIITSIVKRSIGVKTPPKKYYLSVLAIFKNESPWIGEWIEYHRIVGVEHFYMYNNDDDTSESDIILNPYVCKGVVENIHFPGKIKQMSAYREGLKKAKGETEWLAIIDLDEFIYPIKENTVPSVLKKFETYSGLVVHWKIFGSSGLMERPANQISYFLRRAQINFDDNKYIKSIVRPDYVNTILVYDPHFCFYNKGFSVDENHKKVVNGPKNNNITMNDLCIHHYGVRSYQDWIQVKQITGRADVSWSRDIQEFAHRDRNEVFDDGLFQRFGKILGGMN